MTRFPIAAAWASLAMSCGLARAQLVLPGAAVRRRRARRPSAPREQPEKSAADLRLERRGRRRPAASARRQPRSIAVFGPRQASAHRQVQPARRGDFRPLAKVPDRHRRRSADRDQESGTARRTGTVRGGNPGLPVFLRHSRRRRAGSRAKRGVRFPGGRLSGEPQRPLGPRRGQSGKRRQIDRAANARAPTRRRREAFARSRRGSKVGPRPKTSGARAERFRRATGRRLPRLREGSRARLLRFADGAGARRALAGRGSKRSSGVPPPRIDGAARRFISAFASVSVGARRRPRARVEARPSRRDFRGGRDAERIQRLRHEGQRHRPRGGGGHRRGVQQDRRFAGRRNHHADHRHFRQRPISRTISSPFPAP